ADAVAASRSRRTRLDAAAGLSVLGWSGFIVWITVAGATALLAEVTAQTVADATRAGAATIAAAVALLIGAVLSGRRWPLSVATGAVVVSVAVAAVELAAVAWPAKLSVSSASIILAVSSAGALAARALPAWLRPGLRWAVLGVGAPALMILASLAL